MRDHSASQLLSLTPFPPKINKCLVQILICKYKPVLFTHREAVHTRVI